MHPMRVKRFFKGISLDELGARVGIDQGKLSRAERGYATLTEDEKKRLADALNIAVEEIFPKMDSNQN